jgi:hypothetical protein
MVCQIGEEGVNVLCDVGSSVNVIPLSLANKFKLSLPTAGTTKELILANQSTIRSAGTVEDDLVKVQNLMFLVDFMILDIGEDEEHPIILGRPFLATSRTIFDMDLAEMTLRSGEQVITSPTSKRNMGECCKLEWKNEKAIHH